MRSVVLEGLVIGLLASVVGLFAGVGIAKAMNALVGSDLPDAGLVFAPRTIIISLALGTLITLVASILPARRATPAPPIAAGRGGSVLPPPRLPPHPLKAAVGGVAGPGGAVSLGGVAGGPRTNPVAAPPGVGV